jgi:2-amino-4-hydroxy-6-hydroxymethyldihydropteridine diphosphokinase
VASRLYESGAIGGPDGQPAFLNAAARLQTDLTPRQLLALLHETERQLGRVRERRWAARRIDLDLLLYDQRIIDTPTLVVPHPRMAFRRFVLVPAVEIAADMTHPGTGWALSRLLTHLDSAANYLAVTGPPGVGKTRLVAELCRSQGWRLVIDPCREMGLRQRDGNSAGSALQAEIELLGSRAKRLMVEDALWATGEVVLSDYWLDQSLVYARQTLAGGPRDAFEAAWLRARENAVQPKILVLLDASEPPDGLPPSRVGDDTAQDWRRTRANLAAQARISGQGPLLRLQASDLDWASSEIVAAAQAMRETVD